MHKKIFAVSDIHGHYTQLKAALDEAGFSSSDDTHLLVVCGDLFDRGEENRLVFEYLRRIPNKILIRGNHEDILNRILRERRIVSVDYHNGLDRTIKEFFGSDVIREKGFLDLFGKDEEVFALTDMIFHMCDYFETKHYIFTHGWLPTEWDEAGKCKISKSFRHDRPAKWERARFAEWYTMYRMGMTVKGKTIVCGHRAAQFGYAFDRKRSPEDSSVFRAEGIAAIDALTVQSKRVNVLVIENEELLFKKHEMKLKNEPFTQIRDGKKKAELRLFDDKRKKLKIGDEIVFTNADAPSEKLCATVVGLHYFYHFNAIAWDFDKSDLGIPEEASSIADYMSAYYSDDEVWQKGAFVIRLQCKKTRNP